MMLTEEQAKTKWCPFARQATGPNGHGPAFNRSAFGWEFCVASTCACWRWDDPSPAPAKSPLFWPKEDDIEVLRRGEPDRGADLPAAAVWVPITGQTDDDADGGFWELPAAELAAIDAENLARRRGHCGLAGCHGASE